MMNTAFTPYRLPDGRVIPVQTDAAKFQPVIGFTEADGTVVDATLVREQEDGRRRLAVGDPVWTLQDCIVREDVIAEVALAVDGDMVFGYWLERLDLRGIAQRQFMMTTDVFARPEGRDALLAKLRLEVYCLELQVKKIEREGAHG